MLKVLKYHRGYKLISGLLAFLIVFSSLAISPVLYKGNGFIKKALAEEDTTAPTESLTSPSDGSNAVFGETVTITANASDNVGVTRVEFYVDDSYVGESVYAPYTYD
jgi:hypothetical protein